MRFRASFRQLSVDIDGYKKKLTQVMEEATSVGILMWLDTVLQEIPVWSGASRATFVKLASEIEYSIPISPVTTEDRTAEGMASSTGRRVSDERTGDYYFEYSTTLPWLIWNEYHNANVEPDATLIHKVIKEGPYQFQKRGQTAFIRMASSVRLPPVKRFIRAGLVMR